MRVGGPLTEDAYVCAGHFINHDLLRGTIEWFRCLFGAIYEEEPPLCSASSRPSGSMHSPVLGVQAAGPPGRPGFADVEDYLRVRRVAEGWSLQQMVAELHVASAWLEREMDQLQIPRPRSVEVASIVMGASRPIRVKLDPRLGADRAVRLQRGNREALGHLGRGIPDVDLAAGDAEAATLQRRRRSRSRLGPESRTRCPPLLPARLPDAE
jgi:hypothetical protein